MRRVDLSEAEPVRLAVDDHGMRIGIAPVFVGVPPILSCDLHDIWRRS
jgi:hypothetical protein